MAKTLATLRGEVLRRLNDEAQTFWAVAEVDRYLGQAYREVARLTRCLWDLRYLENLPAGFSYTALWEADYLDELDDGFDYGCANYTLDDERRLLTETDRVGPANHTSPFEATDLWLNGTNGCGANDAIPATATLSETAHTVDRATWDDKAIGVLRPVEAARLDSRYQLTEGDVYALVMKSDGLQTVRKVRVPAAQADTYQVGGSWGVLRDPTDISDADVTGDVTVNRMFSFMGAWEQGAGYAHVHDVGRATYTAAWESTYLDELGIDDYGPANHTYADEYTRGVAESLTMTTSSLIAGIPRQLPVMHPMGSESFGLPRRPYRDGKNVRVEHWREGRQVSVGTDVFEVSDRVTVYVREYAMSRCLGRSGPAQDLRLAKHYDQRYRRGMARLERRMQAQQRMRVGAMGSGGVGGHRGAPPRPKLPWNYGQELR